MKKCRHGFNKKYCATCRYSEPKKIKVGKNESKEVNELNHLLYNKAEQILEENRHLSHIGWSGVGKFIDWLEQNYTLTKRDGRKKL